MTYKANICHNLNWSYFFIIMSSSSTYVKPAPIEFNLSMEELMSYAEHNKELHSDLKQFSLSMTIPSQHKGRKGNTQRPRGSNIIRRHAEQSSSRLIKSKLNETDSDKLYSNLRGQLNRLTNNNYEDIVEEIVKLIPQDDQDDNYDHIQKLVELIFEKAVSESRFSVAYSHLCNKLSINYKDCQFNDILLTRCQKMFEQGFSNKSSDADQFKNLFKHKENLIGYIRFIGELYNCELLTDNILNNCFQVMFVNSMEYTIECLCNLMITVSDEFTKRNHTSACECYIKLKDIKDSAKTGIKDRFRIMDLLDNTNVPDIDEIEN